MSSPRTKPEPLSDNEIRQIAAALAEGRPPMVWFTPAAVGVSEGRSGKVIALGDPAEGDFLQIRPTGSRDVMSFSPTEVTLAKPARKDRRSTNTARSTAPSPSATRKDTAVSMQPTVTAPTAPPSPAPATAETPASQAASGPKATPKPAAAGAVRPPRDKPAAAARKSKAPEVTVTLAGTVDGEWTVDVVHGKKRIIKGLSVAGAAVSQAAKLLDPEVAGVVDSVLEAVRNTQRAKVEQLQAELEQARRLLDELAG